MNFRVTLGLLGLLAVLAGAVWYLDLREPAKPTATSKQVVVLDLKPEDVTRIEVSAGGQTVAADSGADGQWALTTPAAPETDSRRIDDQVGRIARLNANRKLDPPVDLAAYGLATPAGRVVLTTAAGATELLIGAQTPDKNGQYVKTGADDAAYIVSSFLIGDLLRWPTDPPVPKPTPPLPAPAPKP